MAVTHQSGLHDKILQALQQARKQNDFVLVSHVKKVNDMIPVHFFNSVRHLNTKNRVFWFDPFEALTFVGLGSTYTIKSNDKNRFENVEKEWKRLMSRKCLDQDTYISGTGPVLLGGFSFDPIKKKTSLWEDFSEAQFIVPTFLLTKRNNELWFTTNVLVTPQDDMNTFTDLLEDQEKIFENKYEPAKMVSKSDREKDEIDRDDWIRSVEKVTNEIREGQMEKVVLARELRVRSRSPFQVEEMLERLEAEQPESYVFAFEFNDSCFLGASPERLIKKNQDEFLSTCLAGSIERGKSEHEDLRLGQRLLEDEKNRLEHQVVVRMIKNAMDKCCSKVSAPKDPVLYKVRDIQHLYTPVIGLAHPGVTLLQMVKQLHPTPALGGYPKEVAIKKIREEESLDRGWYAAPVGWLDETGNGEFAVAIRSGLIKGKQASLFAGCGIVGNSDPMSEYNETQMKFKPMMSALGGLEDVSE